jgi:hypothetical protein
LRIQNVNHPHVAAGFRLTNRDAGALAADSILKRFTEDFLDFGLVDIMVVNVRLARGRDRRVHRFPAVEGRTILAMPNRLQY